MITILLTILHVFVSFFLILVVLAQQGKGQDLASAFGGTGSSTAFGARGTATLLSKITAGAAALFVVTSLSLGYLKPAASSDTVLPSTPSPGASEPATTPEAEPDKSEAETPAAEESKPPAGADTPADEDTSPGTEKPKNPQ